MILCPGRRREIIQPAFSFKFQLCILWHLDGILLISRKKDHLHQSHKHEGQGFTFEVLVHLHWSWPRRGPHSRPHSWVHPANRGARFLIHTFSRALLYAGIIKVVQQRWLSKFLKSTCLILGTCHLFWIPLSGNLGVSQVPEIVHYRESSFDMSIIIFILCINVAEFLCHIFLFRARLLRIYLPENWHVIFSNQIWIFKLSEDHSHIHTALQVLFHCIHFEHRLRALSDMLYTN